jgi:PAS domain S-box-containing protein
MQKWVFQQLTGIWYYVPILLKSRTTEDVVIKNIAMHELGLVIKPEVNRRGLENMHKESKRKSSEQENLKRIEKELQESELRYHMLIEQLPDNILIHDLEGKILYTNASRVEVLGAKNAEEIIGRNAMELVHPESREYVMNAIKESLEEYHNGLECKKVLEHKFIRFDGSEFYGEATGVPFFYKGQLAIQTTVRDITRRKQAEEALNKLKDNLENMVEERTQKLEVANELLINEIEDRKRIEEQKDQIQTQLFQAQKMEVVGRFASGIAHDFNNINTIIKTVSGLALDELSEDFSRDQVKEYLETINATTERGANLTRQLLISTRNQPTTFKQLKPGTVIESMTNTLRHILEENIVIRTVLAPDLWDINADKGNIDQIIMNLVLNARDSMVLSGGMIYVKAENVVIDEECMDVPDTKPGKYVCIIVEDSGAGMERTVVDRLFEPFFSTKAPGKGLGLGLSVISTIVKMHNGAIIVSSEPEKGSVFKVYFPAISNTALVEDKGELLKKPIGHGERILLVEDESFLLKSLALMLSKSNYLVFQAKNAKEAIDIFEKESGEIDLVFTDVVLPGRSGVQLVEELLIKKPELKVIFTSGYLDIESQWPFIQKGGYGFFQKPYDQLDLLMTINETLTV